MAFPAAAGRFARRWLRARGGWDGSDRPRGGRGGRREDRTSARRRLPERKRGLFDESVPRENDRGAHARRPGLLREGVVEAEQVDGGPGVCLPQARQDLPESLGEAAPGIAHAPERFRGCSRSPRHGMGKVVSSRGEKDPVGPRGDVPHVLGLEEVPHVAGLPPVDSQIRDRDRSALAKDLQKEPGVPSSGLVSCPARQGVAENQEKPRSRARPVGESCPGESRRRASEGLAQKAAQSQPEPGSEEKSDRDARRRRQVPQPESREGAAHLPR